MTDDTEGTIQPAPALTRTATLQDWKCVALGKLELAAAAFVYLGLRQSRTGTFQGRTRGILEIKIRDWPGAFCLAGECREEGSQLRRVRKCILYIESAAVTGWIGLTPGP